MITLREFLDLSMDNFYALNIWDCEEQKEIEHQKEVGELLESEEFDKYLNRYIQSWDIDFISKELTINI